MTKKIICGCITILVLLSIAVPFFSFAEKGNKGGPYYIYGYVYDVDDSLLCNAPVTITDLTVNQSTVVTTDSSGYYQHSISTWSYSDDDVIRVNATHGACKGENTTVVNTSGSLSECNVRLTDPTPPSTPMVSDDGEYTMSTSELHAEWLSNDEETGIVENMYAIGTTPNGNDVVGWASAGVEQEITKSGLVLENNQIYYFAVKTRNRAGAWSSIGMSDGIIADALPPSVLNKSPSGDNVLRTMALNITFSEPMNTTTVENGFSITPDPGGWVWEWNTSKDSTRMIHDPFESSTDYSCEISNSVEDKAGNKMTSNCSWSFTTVPGLSVTLNSPYGYLPEDWTGGSEHTISYTIADGDSPYTVYLNYTVDGITFPICSETKYIPKTYTYYWVLPGIDSETVKVSVEVVDDLGVVCSDMGNNFIIDSAPPIVNSVIPLNNTEAVSTENINIKFSEPMNTSSVESGFSIMPDPEGWTWAWCENNSRAILSHNDFETGTVYNCSINTSAKDDSEPGNRLMCSYFWCFNAVAGKGDFTVQIDYPSSVEIDENCSIVVTVFNTGKNGFNVSGSLSVKFYRVSNGKSVLFDTQYIAGMGKDENASITSKSFAFDVPGTQQIRIEISSTNPVDIIENETQFYETTVYINVNAVSLSSSVETGDHLLTGIMISVIAVSMVSMLIVFGMKKMRWW